MNQAFASTFFGRIFLHPDVVFTEEMLRPELQNEAVFADSVDIIVTTHKVVAEHYRADVLSFFGFARGRPRPAARGLPGPARR